MLRKLTLALVAAASLGTIALAPTAASAHGGWHGGGHGGWHGGWGFRHHHFYRGIAFVGGGYGGDGCYVTRSVLTPFGYRLRTVNVCVD